MSPGVYIQERDRGSRRIRRIVSNISGGGGGSGPSPEVLSYYLYGSGDNDYFQILQPDNISYIPIEVEGLTTESSVKQLFNVEDSVFALKTDGSLWAWGNSVRKINDEESYNIFLGSGSSVVPIKISPSGTWDRIEIAQRNPDPSGYDNTVTAFGIKTNGTLWGWGYNGDNVKLLSMDSTKTFVNPIEIDDTPDWTDISLYGTEDIFIGIRNGKLYGWGSYTFSSLFLLGLDSGFSGSLPEYDFNNGTQITIYSGTPIGEQLPNGAVIRDAPLDVTQVGEERTGLFAPDPEVMFITNAVNVVSFGGVTVILRSDGTLWSAGYSTTGALGQTGQNTSTVFKQIGTDSDWTFLGRQYAIKANGSLYSWGEIFITGTNEFSPILTTSGSWDLVSGQPDGLTHAIKSDGTLWTWGDGEEGAHGYGGHSDITVPLQVGTDSDWSNVFTNVTYAQSNASPLIVFGTKTNGKLYAWGNVVYQGTENVSLVGYPLDTPVATSTVFTQLSETDGWVSGSSFLRAESFLVIKNDGTAWGWGDNDVGQLGTGNRYITKEIKPVTGSHIWKSVNMGVIAAGGITTDGKLYMWGSNERLQLGNGGSTIDVQPSPVWIAQDSTWKSLSVGDSHVLALSSSGTLWAWGDGEEALGLGEGILSASVPTQVGTDSDWESVFAYVDTSFAIKTNGSLYSWGYNPYIRLGYGDDYGSYYTPGFVDAGPWKYVSSFQTTRGLKTDGTLWGWGQNFYGIIPDPTASFSDEGISGVHKDYSIITGGEFVAEPFTSVRLLVDTGSCTTSSLSNSLLGSGSLTLDDTPTFGNSYGYWEVSLPFNVVYGGTSYSTLYISTNSAIWFGIDYSSDYLSISETDGLGDKLYYGQEGDTFRIRFEGTANDGPKIWEVVFYQNITNQIDVHVGENSSWTGTPADPQPIPSQINLDIWKSVETTAESEGFFAIKSDGTLWGMGGNGRGQIGVGNTSTVTTLTQIGSSSNWQQIFPGRYTTVGLRTS